MTEQHLFRIVVKPDEEDTERTYFALAETPEQAADHGRTHWYDQMPLSITTIDEAFSSIEQGERARVTVSTVHKASLTHRRQFTTGMGQNLSRVDRIGFGAGVIAGAVVGFAFFMSLVGGIVR